MLKRELIGGRAVSSPADVRFNAEYDAVVAGAGTAGAVAALLMAEHGLSVCGVEKLNLPGGTATLGGISGYYYGLPGGRFEQIDAAARELGKGFVHSKIFHSDAKGIVLEREMIDRGVELLYESAVIAVFLSDDGRSILGAEVATPDGIRRIGCRILLDGSGNGEICAMAGAAFREGRESDGKCQPYSSVRVFRRENSIGAANFDAGYIRTGDAADFTRGIIHSNALHVKPAGEPQDDLYWISPLPGVREGRLIECDETLIFAGFMAGEKTPNRICGYAYSNFDSHSQDWALTDRHARDWMVCSSLWGKNFAVPITLEMLLVKNFENLIVIGRALSVDHIMASLLRMEPCMQKTGEIAARAAVLSCRKGCSLRDVNRDELEKQLRSSGCLDETVLPDCSFPTDDATLRALLLSNKPGEAIWYASRNMDRCRTMLLELLASGHELGAPNSAVALGMAGEAAALPELRGVVRQRDDFLPSSGRAQNQRRILAAIDLLGRFGQAEDAALLLGFLAERPEDMQIASHLMRSLLELGDALPEYRAQIEKTVGALLHDDTYRCDLLLKNSSNLFERVTEPLKGSLARLAESHFNAWRNA